MYHIPKETWFNENIIFLYSGLSTMLPVLLVLSIACLVAGNPVTLNKDESGFYVIHPSDETAGHYQHVRD